MMQKRVDKHIAWRGHRGQGVYLIPQGVATRPATWLLCRNRWHIVARKKYRTNGGNDNYRKNKILRLHNLKYLLQYLNRLHGVDCVQMIRVVGQ